MGSTRAAGIAYLVFALIGTLGIGIAVGIYFAMGTRSEKLLTGLKDWMSRHNAAIMTSCASSSPPSSSATESAAWPDSASRC